jgi:hypothetical protein
MSNQKENKIDCEYLDRKKVFNVWEGKTSELWCSLHKQYLIPTSCQGCTEFRQREEK